MSSSVRGLVAQMLASLLAFVKVVSSGVSFGVLFLLFSPPSPSVPLQVLELSRPSPAGTGSQSCWGRPLTGCLTQARTVMVSES